MTRILLALASLLALAAPALAQAPTKIALGYGITSDYLPAFIAKDTGIFDRHGLDVTMSVLASSSLAPPALVGGSLQIAMATPPNLLLAYDGGLDLVAISGVARLTAANPRTSLVTRPGFVVTKAEDLRGRKVAVPGISSAMDLTLRKWLIDAHVPVSEVTIAEVPFQQMGDMLKGAQIDAAYEFEPVLSRILAAGTVTKSVDIMSLETPDTLGSTWASTRDWASTHRPAVEAYRAALVEAVDYIARNPADAHKIEAKYLGYSTPTLPDVSLAVTPDDFKFWAAVCEEVGVLHRPVEPANFIFK
jgi:NitT/TauT family transport system substrate-binding protein